MSVVLDDVLSKSIKGFVRGERRLEDGRPPLGVKQEISLC